MSRRSQLNSIVSAYDGQSNLETFDYGIVIDVVTDINHPRINTITRSNDDVIDKTTSLIGAIFVKRIQDPSSNKENTKPFFPKNRQQIQLPIIGETVKLFKDGAKREYERIASHPDLNIGNYVEGNANFLLPNDEKTNKSSSKKYQQVSTTGITNTTGGNTKEDDELGKYFTNQKVHALRLYEGDTLYQSRFGQSLRFSAYNNPDEEFSPTIILRNRQNSESLEKKFGDIIEEDINKDGSTILLSSNKYKIPFQPGIVDDKGTNNFETEPINATIPQELVGYDQMLLNSERIILSSKSQEMLFYSRGDVSFITDGRFTIDAGNKGADLDFGDDVNITTDRNDGDFSVNTGNGSIYLNTDEQGNSPSRTGPQDASGQGSLRKEPLVRGQVLVDLMTELLDEMLKMTYATPSGPTAQGPLPTHQEKLRDIKSRLKDFQSTKNFTE
jgi:hypothetical protein